VPKGFREKSTRYRAVIKSRRALRARGMSRYEVRGLESDKALVKDVAKRLAENGPAAEELRRTLKSKVAPLPEERGAVWRWLRASPLVGVDWHIEREFTTGRKVDL